MKQTGYLTEVTSAMDRILVIEYPKSGGTWLTSMLGDALSLPKRDIYVSDSQSHYDAPKHPWYEGATSLDLTDVCVIKSHELPDSPLHNFPARYIHMLRDGRDVIISKYFFEKDFCVRNGLYEKFETPFDDYVQKVAIEWSNFVLTWFEKEDVIMCRYEELLADTPATLRGLFLKLGEQVNEDQIRECIQNNVKEKISKSLDKAFKYNTFVRKGIVGDWKNYFTRDNEETVKTYAGETLIKTGYENNLDW